MSVDIQASERYTEQSIKFCSDNEIFSAYFIAYWLSIAPVVEKAQHAPHVPWRWRVGCDFKGDFKNGYGSFRAINQSFIKRQVRCLLILFSHIRIFSKDCIPDCFAQCRMLINSTWFLMGPTTPSSLQSRLSGISPVGWGEAVVVWGGWKGATVRSQTKRIESTMIYEANLNTSQE